MPMHTEVCIVLDIAHFPSLMYGFIMQQVFIINDSSTLYNSKTIERFQKINGQFEEGLTSLQVD